MDRGDASEVEVLTGRLMMARKWFDIYGKAYDALQQHGVNFKTLPEYLDTKWLDQADRLPFKRGVQMIMQYLERLENGIAAAVRRKGFKLAPV